MNYRIIVNEKIIKDLEFAKKELMNVVFSFDKEGVTLFKGRNTIKKFEKGLDENNQAEKTELIVKRYKTPNFIQKIVYTYFGKTKANKAYHNATKLVELGFDTPSPIAYIEGHNICFVTSYYYITTSNYNPPIEDGVFFEDRINEQMCLEFGIFVAQLHEKGILHHDLNRTNVLYELRDNKYHFSLIDINRMRFYNNPQELTPEKCFDNLTRFTASLKVMNLVLNSYINYRGWDLTTMLPKGLQIKKDHDYRWERRKNFFKKFKKKKT